jgi:molybdopterin synthase catalytic subunit
MDLNKMISALKKHPRYHSMGMIASHLGVVRETSLKGGKVVSIEVSFNKNKLDLIINDIENLPGIDKVLVETSDGRLKVGDEIMAVVIGGDIRDHVFPSLIMAVDRIKKEAVTKREIFEKE